jgi:Flp pilus assembly protein TadG
MPSIIIDKFKTIHRMFGRLSADQHGNILMMMGLAIIPLTFAVGCGVDYSRAEKLQTRLNAAADAAALAGIDPAMLFQTDAVAKAAATNMFQSQAGTLSGLANLSVDIALTDNAGGSLGTLRSITVKYTADSVNFFGGILHTANLPIAGTSTASASQPPSINFYVAMDNSPSMLLPTTSAGIASLESVNNNCAFSCHIDQYVYNPMLDSSGNWIFITQNYYASGINGITGIYRYNPVSKKIYNGSNVLIGTNGNGASVSGNGGALTYTSSPNRSAVSVNVYFADPFWLGENYSKAYPASGISSIPLRIDAELLAAQNLITTAQNTIAGFVSSPTPIIYQMQYFTFNYHVDPLTTSLTNVTNLTPAMLVPGNGTLAPYMMNNMYYPAALGSTSYPGNYTNNSDSGPLASLASMNALMPDPGSGASRSTPQEVLIIVTDGYQDEMINGSQIRQQWNAAALSQCTAIKNRGIRIAILYTTYDPNTVLPDYPNYAANTPYILPALQSCASPSSSGGSLVYQVSVNQDISAALSALFAMTVQSARLVL